MRCLLSEELSTLLEDWDGDPLVRVTGLSNASSLLFHALADVSWVGFYLTDATGVTLVLGPFQGKVACTRIPFSRGVCGCSARTKKALIVPDVHQFPGHIACDCDSESELVIPMLKDGTVVGVLDLDSTSPSRFSQTDADLLGECVSVIVSKLFS